MLKKAVAANVRHPASPLAKHLAQSLTRSVKERKLTAKKQGWMVPALLFLHVTPKTTPDERN